MKPFPSQHGALTRRRSPSQPLASLLLRLMAVLLKYVNAKLSALVGLLE
jgi:hypothetical protein